MARDATFKQRLFVHFYVGEANGNATRAAQMAGYHHPRQYAPRLLRRPAIRALIDSGLADAALSAEEIVARLSEQAGADIARFEECYREETTRRVENRGDQTVIIETTRQILDFKEIRRRGLGRLVKRIVPGKYGLTLELHDAQAALTLLGKYRGMWRDRLQVDDFDPEKLSTEELKAILARQKRRGGLTAEMN